jgi:hypothetical protein
MDKTILDNYGEFRHIFEGSGIIRVTQDNLDEGQFLFGQKSNGTLIIFAELTNPSFPFTTQPEVVEIVHCSLESGQDVDLVGPYYISRFNYSMNDEEETKVTITWIATDIRIGSGEVSEEYVVNFELTNFLFRGTEMAEVMMEGHRVRSNSLFPVTFQEIDVFFQQIPEYKQAKARIKAQNGVEITATGSIEIEENKKIDDVIEFMDKICDLLTIARGTIISWTSLSVEKDDEVIISIYRNSLTGRFINFGVLNENNSDETRKFLETGFEHYINLDENYRLREIARAYASTRSSSFLEERCLLIGVLAEYIASVNARLNGKLNFIDDEIFDERLDTLKEKVGDIVGEIFPELKRKYIQGGILPKVFGFNQRPLSWKLSSLSKDFDIGIDQQDIDDFKDCRNSLAHSQEFPGGKSPADWWVFMSDIIDRILLRFFGYEGTYYSIRENIVKNL